MTQSYEVLVLSGKDIEGRYLIAGTFASFVTSGRKDFPGTLPWI